MASTAAPEATIQPVMDRENVAPAVKRVDDKQAKPAEKKRCVPRAGRARCALARATETPPHREPFGPLPTVGPLPRRPPTSRSPHPRFPPPRSNPRSDRPKEVKCPRIVTERYKCARTGETKTRTYVRGRPLGKGGFAVVYGMQDPSTGENFAAKVVAKSTLEKERARAKILTEIRIHRGCDNAHVVRFVRCFEDAANVYILMELCSNRTLADVVKARGRLTEPECAAYAREIVTAVAHLHAHRVIHRDLKLGNLFLTPAGLDEATGSGEDSAAGAAARGGGGASSDGGAGGGPGSDAALDDSVATGGRLKIGDFGLACRVESDDERKTTICGTPNYIAPEVLAGSKGGGHSYEVDVWSIGVIIYTLLVGIPPFQTSDVHATYKRIRANAYEFPEGVVNEGARELIRRCLAPKPGDRPKIAEIAAHPLLNAGWRGATPWSMPTPRVDAEKMERSTRSGGAGGGDAAKKPRAPPALSAGGRSRRAPLSPLTVADPSAPRTAPRNVNDATPPPATPAPFDVLDSDVVGSAHLARTPDAYPEVSAAAGPPRRAAEEGAAAATASLESRVASMRLTTEAPAEEDRLAAAEAGRLGENGGKNVDAKTSTSAPIDPAEFATLGMDSPSDGRGAGAPMGFGRVTLPGDASSAPGGASLEAFPPLWVTRWVDYTSKYGLGYVLSDGTFGVVFNDATKMTQSALDDARDDADDRPNECHAASPDTTTAPPAACHDGPPGDRLEYRERARRPQGAASTERRVAPPPACFRASEPCPPGLEKKVKLMRHFRGYLSSDGRSAVERSSGGLGEKPGCEARHPRARLATKEAEAAARSAEGAVEGAVAHLPHVKNWLRTKHAVLFRLSNRTIQVCFQDGSEVLLSSEASACVFTSKSGARTCHSLGALPQDPELLRRLRYVKEVLHQLVSRA